MAKISLRMYDREIEGLVEQGQRLDEAIAHCRHILQTYPKHLETYRLLGKAYLEAKHYDQAVDIFQRVLVATPDDFVAHVGMSIIADDKGRLDDAIWHMERAFEVQPSNAAIQGELQRLFGRRDGIEPPKIRLTRGALAYMYVQGELYNQAISEIRAVLSGDPKRTDMQTLLARAYYRNGQKTEAADICGQLLTRYPYCLDANRLMAEIAPTTGRADAAQEYRQRVVELDPYAAFVTDSIFRADHVADSVVTIERFEYTGETAEMPPALGIGLETDATMMSHAAAPEPAAPPAEQPPSDLPDWLKTGGEAAPPAAPPAPAAADQSDIPPFLRQAGWGEASGAAEQASAAPFEEAPGEMGGLAAVEGELPDWVKALAPAEEETLPVEPVQPAEESDLFQSTTSLDQSLGGTTPDWLSGLGDQEARAPEVARPESPLPAAETPSLPPDVPDWLRDMGPAPSESRAPSAQSPDETPDWLKDLAGRELDEPAAPVKNESEADWLSSLRAEQPPAAPAEPEPEESPAWLKDFGNDLETPIAKTPPPAVEPPAPEPAQPEAPASLGALGTTAQEQDDAMAWLEALAAKHGAKPEELVTDPNARSEAAPEWVDRAKEIGEQAMEPEQPTPPVAEAAQPAEEDQTGMWLRSLAESEQAQQAEAPAPERPEETVEIRSGFAEETEFAAVEPETTQPEAAEPEVAEPEITQPEGAEPEAAKEEPPIMAASETPDWLRDLSESPAESVAAEPKGMEDAPSWLHNIEQEAEAPAEEAAAAPEPLRAEEAGTDLPAWLAGLEKEEEGMAAEAPAQAPSEELPAWLQSEAEPEPEVKEPANPADWRPVAPPEPLPAEPMPAEAPSPVEEKRPEPVEEAKPAHVEPRTRPLPVEQPPVSMPAAERIEKPPEPEPAPARVEKAPEPAAAPPKPRPAVSAPKPVAVSLGDAQSQLGRGNISAALDIYSKLIRKGKSLEDIIRDLRDALYRYPVEVPLWQSLGDAYMRANRLQEALDAYTKAEELLR